MIFFDTETHLIQSGSLTPKLVCVSYVEHDGRPTLVSRDEGLALATDWLTSDMPLVGHNIWFDLGVVVNHCPTLLPHVFRKLEAGQIYDTQLRQEMIDLANGELKFFVDEETGEINRSRYGLADLSWRLLRKRLPKQDTWRLRYGELDGVPINQWPEDASKYALNDASTTAAVFWNQRDQIERSSWKCRHLDNMRIVTQIPNWREQHQAAWVLHLMSMQGVRTDGEAVAQLKATLERDYAEQMAQLRPTGLLRITPPRVLKSGPRKGQLQPEQINKDMRAIYERVRSAYAGRVLPSTDSGRPATDKRTLAQSGREDLKLLALSGATAKLLNTYVPILESGTKHAINARFNPLMETGRTSCSGPNLQNPPKAGGVRECFVPSSPNRVFAFVDYDTLELRSLAQACLWLLGRSKMAEALIRGEDLHLALAAEMMGIPVAEAQARMKAGDPVVKSYRQQAKPANFGFPGGMAADSFREYAEGYGIFLTPVQAMDIREAWFRRWPEMHDYFAKVKTLPDPLVQLKSKRVRGGASFTAASNGFFQGLAADGAKEALYRVAKECYLDTSSALYGSRPVLFLHDEIAIETPEATAAEAGERLATVMREAMKEWIPDIPISCGAVLMRRWYKGAEAVRVDGKLVPSKPNGKLWSPDVDR